ncbi:MAG TPA: single-stranded-DNA-specific exonuclease RecJ [Alphaproteobacteria bacterium]|nr:single-stranded-DNA-specific exonuclease RecJ [Alphaproteobacteria bacterium]
MSALLGVHRSETGRCWRQRPGDDRTALALAQRLDIPDVVGRVLAARGVGPEGGEAFLNPRLRDALPDPHHLRDMARAAARIAAAIQAGEKVVVFGDYDVDGATSSALLKRYFKAVGAEIGVYIPDRQAEGYGPNAPALLRLREEGAAVVVTVDCGVLAFEPLQVASEAGLEVIVVDHHQAEPRLPACFAVVNPNRLDDDSPHGGLAAVGVTFLLLVAINRALREAGWFADRRREPDLLQWLDLVALGTVCDVVPLTGLNRVLVAQGLKVMAQRGNPGLAALCDVAGLNSRPGAYHLGFVLGPRVNAGGRIGKSDLGVRLLSSDDPAEAAALAAELDQLNRERQAIEAMMQEEALLLAEQGGAGALPLVLVASERWHEGVIGIVASRLKEQYRRPAIVCALRDGIAKGSGRSVPGIDLGAAVIAARQAGLLINGGGHAMAAGLTAPADGIAALTAFIAERIGERVAALPEVPELTVDATISVRAAGRELYDLLESAGPYGAGHPEPRFAISSVDVVKADVVGHKHVRVIASGGDGGRLKGIAFNAVDTPLGQTLLRAAGARLHLAGHLRADDWQGRRGVQLVIEDVARAGLSG